MKFAQIFKHKQHQKSKNSGSIKEFIAKLSRGLMLPIAMLPIAGLFLGIGSAITATASDPSGAQAIFGNIISAGGNIIFGCLPVLFCIAIAITFTDDAGVAGLSAFVGWIVFCALQAAMIIIKSHIDPHTDKVVIDGYRFLFWKGTPSEFNAIFTTNLGIQSLSTGVFGGIVVGWCVAFLYNKFKNIQLPQIIGFFSGIRFIPIITFLSMIVLSFLFSILWPWVGQAFYEIGKGLSSAPAGLNSLVFGYFNRALVPFGLHHVINTAMWFSSIGGTFDLNNAAIVDVNGAAFYVDSETTKWIDLLPNLADKDTLISGDINIYILLQQLTGKSHLLIPINPNMDPINNYVLNIDCIFRGTQWSVVDGICKSSHTYAFNPGQYTSGAYIFTLFALPAAGAAMIMAAPKGENRKIATSVIASAAFVCFLTGITEPIEFTFLFLAPWLYWGFHALMGAVAYMIPTCMSLYMPTGMGCHLAFSFSSGFLDFSIYGIIQDAKHSGSNCFWLLLYSAIYAGIYYVVFYIWIKKFDIKTPGRGGQDKLFSKKDYLASKEGKTSEINQLSNAVIKAYGGRDNIKNVDACITKLRIQVVDPSKVNKQALLQLGAKGVMTPSKQSVYAVFGTQADRIKNEIKDIFNGKSPFSTNTSLSADTPKVLTKHKVKIHHKIKLTPHIRLPHKHLVVIAPVKGEVVSTKSVKDETFSKNLMGHGFAIIPESNEFVAPISGEIVLINNHAFGIKTKKGVEILVHVGLDTVKLTNKGVFKPHVKLGQKVNAGTLVLTADLDKIKANKLDTITPVIVLNKSLGKKKIIIKKFGQVNQKAKILIIK